MVFHRVTSTNLQIEYYHFFIHFSSSQLRTVFVKLLSTANTGYTYFTRKNPAKLTHKLFFRKFDPIIRQHVIFEERKK